jgi:ribonucleoside-triphosphate reductase
MMASAPETTDITLFVRTSGEEIARWNRQRIVEALIREALLDEPTAEAISQEVERQIVASGISLLTTALIRELVDAKLIERGLEQARRLHARLGFPLYDVRQLIRHQNKENANLPHAPEGTNLVLAEGIKREYALHDVFSREVGEAHVAGDLHLHGLGYVDRPYSGCQSLEYLKKFGLRLPHSITVAGPARHAEVLLAHMVRFGAALQGHFAGVIGWDAVNVAFAPYLEGMGRRETEQFAQMLVYEFSQLTSTRGGQSIFTDIHLFWEVPPFLAALPAIGPGGRPTGKTCREHGEASRRLASALMAVYRAGDATGKPFVFPRPIIHLTAEFFRTEGHAAFLEEACATAAAMGNPCFVLDRDGGARLAACGCQDLSASGEGEWGGEPGKRRCAAIQTVTLNLPRLGYRAEGEPARLDALLDEALGLAVRAHRQKRDFIAGLLALGDAGPLAMLAAQNDGEPYLRLAGATCIIGVAGLDELVRIRTGKSLHESAAALAEGLRIVGQLAARTGRLSAAEGMRFVLEQTPAETTAYRFARLDLKHFSPRPGRFVRGDLARGEIYYTNATQLAASAPVDPFTRARLEGLFHPFFPAGAVTHLELGAAEPPAADLAAFLLRVFRETQNNQVVFSPEFTTCAACGATSRGLAERCPRCASEAVDGLARITQYLSRVSGWNRGKRAELRDRRREDDASFAAPEA